jgi:hypothetical protein
MIKVSERVGSLTCDYYQIWWDRILNIISLQKLQDTEFVVR